MVSSQFGSLKFEEAATPVLSKSVNTALATRGLRN